MRNDRDMILCVGFKGKNNASFKLVNDMNGDHLFLTNSFKGIRWDIELVTKEYKKVMMFGVDKTLSENIRFESVAKKDGEIVYTSFDMISYLQLAKKNNISYTVSDVSTSYLCNEAYFLMLRKMNCPVLFVHLPGLPRMTESFYEKIKMLFNAGKSDKV